MTKLLTPIRYAAALLLAGYRMGEGPHKLLGKRAYGGCCCRPMRQDTLGHASLQILGKPTSPQSWGAQTAQIGHSESEPGT